MDPEVETQEAMEEGASEDLAQLEETPAEADPAWLEHVQALEGEAAKAREEAAAHGEEADALRAQLSDTLERYRALLLAQDPNVPTDLVQGGSVVELDTSYDRASALVEQLRLQAREQALEQAAQERVPAGAPARRTADVTGLSPQQKIMLGLQQGN